MSNAKRGRKNTKDEFEDIHLRVPKHIADTVRKEAANNRRTLTAQYGFVLELGIDNLP